MVNYQAVASILLFGTVLSVPAQVQQKPDETRFSVVDVVPRGILDEPLVFEVLDDGTVYIAERKGGLRKYDPVTKETKLIAMLPVNYTYAPQSGRDEEGLIGFTLDPNFEQNHFAYFLYASPLQWDSTHVLTRMELRGDSLYRYTEIPLLKYPVQRRTCCHHGGGMTWDSLGNLFITVGNNTGNTGGSQTDERPGREPWDDQRGAASPMDFRGKILRIHPEPNGTYTIPAGNLFPPGTPGTRPEIYTMGHRNPWRVSIDSRTGYIYWGEVGPDAAVDGPNTVGGHDELNQARGPGFFGWPYFVGPNRAYPITDYTTNPVTVGPPKDPARPVNNSRNNTGLRELPPAQPAFISYTYGATERFPEVGSGGRCAIGGPIYHRSDFASPERPWPAYYEGKWLASDCSRRWIMSITMNQNSDYVAMERFLPDYVPVQPIDLKFGPEGDLYVLEYGSTGFRMSPDSRLVRIEYNAGNRAPSVEITSNSRGGTVPLNLTLSSAGTRDPDGDAVRYEWRVAPAAGGAARTFTTANPTVSLDAPGEYTVTLTARDPAGASASKTMRVIAGNEPPNVAVNLTAGNQSFFFPDRPISYAVQVSDREDGTVDPARVAVSIDYVPETFDPATLNEIDRPVDATSRFAVAQALIAKTDCAACHQPAVRAVGPSYQEIATRYRGDNAALTRLVQKVRAGGSGVWGDTNMPAHPSLSVGDVTTIVRYILAATGDGGINTMPLTGQYTADVPEGDNGRGSIVIRGAYTDRGASGLPAQTSAGMLVLRSPTLLAARADVKSGLAPTVGAAATTSVSGRNNGHIAFRNIDLTGIRQLQLGATATARSGHIGGRIEVRLGSPTGELLGQVQVTIPPPAAGGGGGGGGGQGAAQPAQGQAQAGQGQAAAGAGGVIAGGAQPAAPAAGQGGGGQGGGGQGAVQVGPIVDLRPTVGRHDLYLVFRNEQARPIDVLMSLQNVTFIN